MESWELVFVEFGANIKLDIGENNKHVLDIDVKNELVKKNIFSYYLIFPPTGDIVVYIVSI